MTTFTSPPNQNGLTLNAGDTLQVNQGGVATGTTVLARGNLLIEGGTAINTILGGGTETVDSGTADGIVFQATSMLIIGNPSLLLGTLNFFQPISDVYTVVITFLGSTITSLKDTGDAIEVNFGDGLSVAYSYSTTFSASPAFHFFNNGINGTIDIAVGTLDTSPAFSHETAATIVYTAEFGIAPSTSQLSGLTQFTQAQFAYGQKIGVDAGIYAFTALGVALASDGQHFQDTFGPTNVLYPVSTVGDVHFVDDSYASVFGHAGTAAQIQHFVDQLNFYEGIYTAAGTLGDASNIDLLARGAVYGQMLGVEHGIDLGTPVGGTIFTAPPDQNRLILNAGDILDVNKGGRAFETTINAGGVVNVNDGGSASATTINAGGVVNVADMADSFSFIHAGGVENVNRGGHTSHSSIQGGVENVERGGRVSDVDLSSGVLKLAEPAGLDGTISLSMFPKDHAVIDFENIQVIGAFISIDLNDPSRRELVVTFADHGQIKYHALEEVLQGFRILLALQPDGQGGTNLIFSASDESPSSIGLVGVQHDLAV